MTSPPSVERKIVAPRGRLKRVLARVLVHRTVLLVTLRLLYWVVRIVRALFGG